MGGEAVTRAIVWWFKGLNVLWRGGQDPLWRHARPPGAHVRLNTIRPNLLSINIYTNTHTSLEYWRPLLILLLFHSVDRLAHFIRFVLCQHYKRMWEGVRSNGRIRRKWVIREYFVQGKYLCGQSTTQGIVIKMYTTRIRKLLFRSNIFQDQKLLQKQL